MINEENIDKYIKDNYGVELEVLEGKELIITPLLQNDYGEANDCTLTSITTLVNKELEERTPVQEIYNKVEEVAKKFFYNGKIWGTIPIFICAIMRRVYDYFGISYKKMCSGYFKGCGVTFDRCKELICEGKPFILNLFKDGQGYYNSHSVTVIGYRIYNYDVVFLAIYDNWEKEVRFIDFEKLSCICSMNWVEK